MKLNPPLSVAGLCLFLMVGISWQAGAYDEDDLEKPKATGDCSGCDLSEVFLQGADLTGGNLTKAQLDNANLTRTIFCGTKMPDESFNDSGC